MLMLMPYRGYPWIPSVPILKFGVELGTLPCSPCHYCERAHNNWSRFKDKVDYVIPLGRVPSNGVTESQSSLLNGLQPNESEGEIESNLVLRLTRYKELSNGLLVSQIDIVLTVDKKNTWLDTVSTDELKEKQSQDPEIQWIIAWLKTGTSPSSNELYLANKGTKNNWINKSSFKLDKEGLLYKLGPGDKNLLVVPRHFQELALYLCRDIPSSAHQGIERTKVRVKDK